MSRRKGLGKGRGKGYKNILMAHDKRVHKDSGRGRKQPQRLKLLNFGQLKSKGIFLRYQSDEDKDGIVNIKDCRPLDPMRQGKIHNFVRDLSVSFKHYKRSKDFEKLTPKQKLKLYVLEQEIKGINNKSETKAYFIKHKKFMIEIGLFAGLLPIAYIFSPFLVSQIIGVTAGSGLLLKEFKDMNVYLIEFEKNRLKVNKEFPQLSEHDRRLLAHDLTSQKYYSKDSDKDKVPDYRDCEPLNPKKQDRMTIMKAFDGTVLPYFDSTPNTISNKNMSLDRFKQDAHLIFPYRNKVYLVDDKIVATYSVKTGKVT